MMSGWTLLKRKHYLITWLNAKESLITFTQLYQQNFTLINYEMIMSMEEAESEEISLEPQSIEEKVK